MPELLVLSLLALVPVVAASLRHGLRCGFFFALLGSVVSCLVGLFFPFLVPGAEVWGTGGGYLLVGAASVLTVLAVTRAGRWVDSAFLMLGRHPWLVRGLLLAAPVFMLLGAYELGVRMLTESGIVRLRSPMQTVMKGTEDWRAFTVVAPDSTRLPDPVLFWRPAPAPPRTSQGFLGPEVAIPKPDDVFRIMCYGDSNTEGGGHGRWPASMQRILDGAEEPLGMWNRVEVLNAGCTGYSSYQGLMRFKEEVGRFRPNLVFVSFGWNDLPLAMGQPDKDFVAPSRAVVAIQRVLLRYQGYRLLRAGIGSMASPTTTPATAQSRVPRDDYLQNLLEFAAVAAQHRVAVVFLTRPHREPSDVMRAKQGWRGQVPEYNDLMRTGAKAAGHYLIDVQRMFEEEYPEEFVDGCHFTGKGHDLLAERLVQHLRSRIGR